MASVDMEEQFEAAFDAAVAGCRELTRAEAAEFVDRGFVVVKAAFPKEIAERVTASTRRELKERHGIEGNEAPPADGNAKGGPMRGYIRTAGTDIRFHLKTAAPRALAVQADAVGGAHRLPGAGESLTWRDAAIANLRVPGGPSWQAPHPRQRGWHKDGWHFRHFLHSPEQGLLTVPIHTDILARSGGTFVARDSIAPVARLLERCPAGLHPDGVQGGGYLIPGLVEQCSQFEELTGAAGDLALLHPYLLHRVSVNPSNRPRFIANMALTLAEPMRFRREPGDPYSLVELAVLRALNRSSVDFKATRPAQAVKPAPFRDEVEQVEQRRLLDQEMAAMARRGIVTPAWGREFGYYSNAPSP